MNRHMWRAVLGDDRGAVETSQIFAWIAVVVVAIIGVSAALNALNIDVINWVREQVFSVG
ncbi:MAG TPA: hypothetical protein VHM94_13605 [Acidimicrobiia bacterium]|nr:hypothetical protein [Acidimicrobiia bacterium]